MHEILPPHDHRRLGRELDLFSMPERAPGQALWKPRGLIVWRELERMLEDDLASHGYHQVRSPLLWSDDLWRQSGHAAKFADDMVHAQVRGQPMSLKPMSCPAHCELYRERPRSYRELPLRIAELGHCHRAELSGSLHGLLRMRGFVQDDAHIFCAPDQVAGEVEGCLRLALAVYRRFEFQPLVELSLRPAVRLGDDRLWDSAEGQLRATLERLGVEYREMRDEGAFYGPKIDMQWVDRLGRRWQIGTVQIDHVLPSVERFDLRHVAADGSRQPVVLIHRALIGAFERFIALLLEQYEGRLPPWLAPVQAVVLPLGEAHTGWATDVVGRLESAGLRVELWAGGPLGARIRRARLERLPFMLVGGDAEAASGAVAVRRGDGPEVESLPVQAAVEQVRQEVMTGRLR